MAKSPTLPTQNAVVALLRADNVLSTLATGVFVSVPSSQEYPFLTIDSWNATDLGEFDSPGCESTFVMHAWTRGEGNVAAENILSRVYELLHEGESRLNIVGFQTVVLRFVSAVSMLDPDGRTFHSAATYRIITTPLP